MLADDELKFLAQRRRLPGGEQGQSLPQPVARPQQARQQGDGIRQLEQETELTTPAQPTHQPPRSQYPQGRDRKGDRPAVLIGKDTRLSGYMIETALVAGFTSVGMDVLLTGPIPTPAVGMLARSMRADLGVMISASHNPYDDNGIKLFGPDGFKIGRAHV